MTTGVEPPRVGAISKADGLVAGEWKRRVEAEYRSAALAGEVALELIRTGAPPDLIRDGLRIVDDELTHSELSWEVALAAGADHPPVVDLHTLTDPDGSAQPLVALTLLVSRYFCIGETVAVPLFRLLRRHAVEPSSQRALDAILRDEGRHRQFGWDVLDWVLRRDPQVAGEVRQRLPSMLAEISTAYAGQPHAPLLEPGIARWGLASPSEYAEVLERALEREVKPRFAARGITV